MRLWTRVGVAALAVTAIFPLSHLGAQSGDSVPGQLKELNSSVEEISNKLDGLSDVLGQGGASRNASNFVEVALHSGSADCVNTGRKFDTLLLPDGMEVDFEIPAEHVLVVTEIELLVFGADPGDGVQTRIFRGIGQSVNLAARRESTASADGRIFEFYEFNPGIIVAGGGEICTNNSSLNGSTSVSGHLRGYLAPQ